MNVTGGAEHMNLDDIQYMATSKNCNYLKSYISHCRHKCAYCCNQ